MRIACIFSIIPNVRFGTRTCRRRPSETDLLLKRDFILKTHSAKHFLVFVQSRQTQSRN
ncbi:hypothetical protein NEISUBOT_03283 [Neisseria subflava NJ9703]|uniref:Uncharacterized protein n=1 Tax=Neisseria subflava NJ9703 TaxID=546268 RepID=A0A9W5IT84_NEISU|nr:hypothetical protein NEISUBOT_03283 [Neisseria subflava NJ9703]